MAAFLAEAGAGGGDDPIGFILASHRMLADQRNAYREALRLVDQEARDHLRSDAIAAVLLRPDALRAVRSALAGE